MITNKQYRRLMMAQQQMPLYRAADKAGVSEKTARKYIAGGKLPSEYERERTWKTRKNPFEEDWLSIKEMLETNGGLESKTLFDFLQRTHPGRYQDGQLRSLQRRIKRWRCTEGPGKDVMFDQVHKPGELAQSDYTKMGELNITLGGKRFEHLVFHFVLTYSNWETGCISYSESFESLSDGMQSALWELGAVPKAHQTDQLTAAVQKMGHPDEFTKQYQALLDHYGCKGKKIQVRKPNENGDVEQSNHRFKRAMEQALLLRGSREFSDLGAYKIFLKEVFTQLNRGRKERLNEELRVMKPLPSSKLDQSRWTTKKVGPSSTIRIENNTYSVHSRLIGETLRIRIQADVIELWVAQKQVESLPRLRGKNKHHICYRHIIDSLVRKPGAFDNYRYQDSLYPSSWFRKAYDWLSEHTPTKAAKHYLQILYLSAKESEAGVEKAIKWLLDESEPISKENVELLLCNSLNLPDPTHVHIQPIALHKYDDLIKGLV